MTLRFRNDATGAETDVLSAEEVRNLGEGIDQIERFAEGAPASCREELLELASLLEEHFWTLSEQIIVRGDVFATSDPALIGSAWIDAADGDELAAAFERARELMRSNCGVVASPPAREPIVYRNVPLFYAQMITVPPVDDDESDDGWEDPDTWVGGEEEFDKGLPAGGGGGGGGGDDSFGLPSGAGQPMSTNTKLLLGGLAAVGIAGAVILAMRK